MSAEIVFRAGRGSDHGFVVSSFARAMRGSAYAEGADVEALVQRFARMLERWTLSVATTADAPDAIMGWVLSLAGKTVAHVLVNRLYRQWLTPDHLLDGAEIDREFVLVFPNSRDRIERHVARIRPWVDAS